MLRRIHSKSLKQDAKVTLFYWLSEKAQKDKDKDNGDQTQNHKKCELLPC